MIRWLDGLGLHTSVSRDMCHPSPFLSLSILSYLYHATDFLFRLLVDIMFPKELQLQPCKKPSYANRLPTEILEMIIREYAKISVTLQRSNPMNFLLVCPSWRAIGESCQHLFTTSQHLAVSGHDEVEQLLTLHKQNLIRPSITSLTVKIAPKCTEEPLDGILGPVPAMKQVQEDLDRLRIMFLGDWKLPDREGVSPYWHSLNLEYFSLVVDLSAVSTQKMLLKAWTRAWVRRLNRQWRGMGWTGSEGIYREGYYSSWDR